MPLNNYFNNHPVQFVILNLLIAVVIGLLILVAVHFTLLNATHHGEEVEVPELSGMYIEEAQLLLEANNLKYLVVDSTYDRSRKLGTVIQQVPVAGSHVKKNREIYLSVNAKQVRKVNVPDLRDISYRQAKVQLEATGLKVDTTYEESEYADLVLDMKYNNQPIRENTWLKEGEEIVLVIGKGKNTDPDEAVVVPNLIGLSISMAKGTISNCGLRLGGCVPDKGELDTLQSTYWVYDQEPQPRAATYPGATISIFVSTDSDKAEHEKVKRQEAEEHKAEEEDFY